MALKPPLGLSYCAVAAPSLSTKDRKLIYIGGDAQSDLARAALHRGAASQQLLTHPSRLSQVCHRRPGGTAAGLGIVCLSSQARI